MRIHFKLSSSEEVVPFNHSHLITGKIHNWIGKNDVHDQTSLYSFSQLQNGKTDKNKSGLVFNNGSGFFFSSWDKSLIKEIVASVQASPDFIYGMKVRELVLQETPDLLNKTVFQIASPIFIKRKNDNNIDFCLYDNPNAGEYLEETMRTKMRMAGLEEDSTLKIDFIKSYRGAKTKLISYRGIKNKCSWCPVIIEGKPETKAFAWHVGLGNSTGIGFGALK